MTNMKVCMVKIGMMKPGKSCSRPCRCIKPNPQSQPGSLDPSYVLEQLRAGGVLEAVRIACAGFPTRKAFRPFAVRYNILLASGRGAYHHLDPETLQVITPHLTIPCWGTLRSSAQSLSCNFGHRHSIANLILRPCDACARRPPFADRNPLTLPSHRLGIA